MLTVIGIDLGHAGQVKSEEHIPLSYCGYDGILPDPYLWRIGNMESSLLEISIHPQTHVLSEVTLVSYEVKNLPLQILFPRWEEFEIVAGVPIVDTSCFEERHFSNSRLDVSQEFRIGFSETFVQLILDPLSTPRSCIVQERIRFFVSQNQEICCIDFINLTASEIANVKSLVM